MSRLVTPWQAVPALAMPGCARYDSLPRRDGRACAALQGLVSNAPLPALSCHRPVSSWQEPVCLPLKHVSVSSTRETLPSRGLPPQRRAAGCVLLPTRAGRGP